MKLRRLIEIGSSLVEFNGTIFIHPDDPKHKYIIELATVQFPYCGPIVVTRIVKKQDTVVYECTGITGDDQAKYRKKYKIDLESEDWHINADDFARAEERVVNWHNLINELKESVRDEV